MLIDLRETVNTVLLALFTAMGEVTWERETQSEDELGRVAESIGSCHLHNWLPFLIPLAVVNVGGIVVAVYQVYVARDISTEFAESEYIAKAMIVILLVSFIGIPVVIIVKGEPRAFYFVATGIIFVMSMSLLLLIFVPKVKSHWENDPNKIKNAIKTTTTSTTTNSDSIGLQVINRQKSVQNLQQENTSLKRFACALKGRLRDLQRQSEVPLAIDATESHVSFAINLPESDDESDDPEDVGLRVVDARQMEGKIEHENAKLKELQLKLESRISKLESVRSLPMSSRSVLSTETKGLLESVKEEK